MHSQLENPKNDETEQKSDLADFSVRLKRSLYGYELSAFSFTKHIKPIVDVLGEESAGFYFEGTKRILALLSEEDAEFITNIAINNPNKATEIMKEILLKVNFSKDECKIIQEYIDKIGVPNFGLYTVYKNIKEAQGKGDQEKVDELKKGYEILSKIQDGE